MSTDDVFSIFILKSNPSVLGSAEAFLRNRNWNVASATSLREAMAYMIKNQPQFVLISVDHPNKKVRSLPKLLAQAFSCRVIPLVEKQSPAATRALAEMNLEYTLNAPVSGPGIQRLILRIRKEDETRDTTGSSKIGLSKNTSNDDSQQVHVSGGFDSAREALSQLLALESDSVSAQGPIIQEGMGGKDGIAHWGSAAGATGPTPSAIATGPRATGYSETAGGPSNESKSATTSGAGHQTGAAYTPDQQSEHESFADYAERMRTMAESNAGWDAPPPQKNAQMGYLPNQQPNMEGESEWGRPDRHKGLEDYGEDDFAAAERKKKKSASFIQALTKEDLSKHPLIEQGAQKALNEASEKNENVTDQTLQPIEKSSNVACITVDSPSFKGYLVCAMGRNRKIDPEFVDTIRNRLGEFLKANGENFSEKDSLLLRIQEVEFDEWALNQAEFLRKSIHNENEVAVAFFPTAEIEPPVEISRSEKMLMMELKELKEDTALEFDLYVYLPENQKYLLYTPHGMVFYTSQKGRLREKGVTHMHLRKESIPQVKKYRAQNFLNEKIRAFKVKTANKS